MAKGRNIGESWRASIMNAFVPTCSLNYLETSERISKCFHDYFDMIENNCVRGFSRGARRWPCSRDSFKLFNRAGSSRFQSRNKGRRVARILIVSRRNQRRAKEAPQISVMRPLNCNQRRRPGQSRCPLIIRYRNWSFDGGRFQRQSAQPRYYNLLLPQTTRCAGPSAIFFGGWTI